METRSGYLDGSESDWNVCITSVFGRRIGEARIVAAWPIKNPRLTRQMFQVEANIDGVFYTGRCCGVSLPWRGRRKSRQSWTVAPPSGR